MSISYDFGKEAENFAANYLLKEGYQILARNYFSGKAEIDIIAQFNHEIIIVEVKSRSKKKKLLILAADDFIQKNNFISEVRFDILALLKTQQSWSVNHIINAFNASEI